MPLCVGGRETVSEEVSPLSAPPRRCRYRCRTDDVKPNGMQRVGRPFEDVTPLTRADWYDPESGLS